jgi:protein phosphatase
VQALVDRGIISPEAAAAHPRRNIITASLAGSEGDVVSVATHAPQRGDRWVLCSDGLTDYVPEADVGRLVAGADDPRSAASSAVALALEAGTRDNVTVVVCDVVDDDVPAGEAVFFGSAARWFTEDVETA